MSFATGKRITPIDRHVAEQLRAARTSAGVTQQSAAKHLRLTHRMIQQYESADTRITAGKLFQLSQLYRKPITAFFQGAPT